MWIDDQILKECEKQVFVKFWIPSDPLVVLGRSNELSSEVNEIQCARDNISITKRLGGGGTVLLSKGCLVLSVGCWVRDYYQNDLYFKNLNLSIIDVIQSKLPGYEFKQRGYSDIVINDRKFVGTSLFRSRNYLLFQASILVELKIEDIEKYLPHPSAEPDYRSGRKHRDFLMGLDEICPLSTVEWMEYFAACYLDTLWQRLGDQLIPPQSLQIGHVQSRIGENHL